MSRFEQVYTVSDWYDGPRGGIADFGGTPHIYRSLYMDGETLNPAEDHFELSPVSSEFLALAVENYRLWARWQASYNAGTAPEQAVDAERVLPEDLPRHRELSERLRGHLDIDSAKRIVARGEFRPRRTVESSLACSNPDALTWTPTALEVQWTPLGILSPS